MTDFFHRRAIAPDLKSAGRLISATLLIAVLLIPINFVELSSAWRAADAALVALGCSLGLVSLLARSRTSAAWALISILLLITLLSTLAGGLSTGSVYLTAPFVLGAGLSRLLGGPAFVRAMIILASLLAISLLIDGLSHGPTVSSFFGSPFQISDLTGSRARGFSGQPVPAAFAATVLTAFLLPVAAQSPKRKTQFIATALVLAQLATSLFLTGTRSALLVAALVLVIHCAILARKKRLSFVLPLALWMPAILASIILVAVNIGSSIQNSRLGSFSSLSGTESLANRLLALEYLNRWANSNDPIAILIGQGPRALQSNLTSFRGSYLSTIDNFYVTLLWDFGVVGAVMLLATLILFMRSLSSGSAVTVGAAVAGIAILLSGATFDMLYTRLIAVLFGAVVWLCLDRDRPSSRFVNDRSLVRSSVEGS